MGEPGRLSLDDKDRFKEDSDRLVCSRFDCFVIFRKRELRFLLSWPSLAEGLLFLLAILAL